VAEFSLCNQLHARQTEALPRFGRSGWAHRRAGRIGPSTQVAGWGFLAGAPLDFASWKPPRHARAWFSAAPGARISRSCPSFSPRALGDDYDVLRQPGGITVYDGFGRLFRFRQESGKKITSPPPARARLRALTIRRAVPSLRDHQRCAGGRGVQSIEPSARIYGAFEAESSRVRSISLSLVWGTPMIGCRLPLTL